ncbi:hypothetical protein DVH05_025540 [Phytophthora capsici]|nr:hypothetical protein DVH05_025540 [Phytophthora capsici]
MVRSSKFGTVNYSADEMRRLNAKVRAVLPLVGEDWLRVAYYFNYQRPEAIPFRDVESLKRKFKKMYCSRGKSLPDYVVEAKELRENIQQSTKQTTETEDQEKELEEKELTQKLRQMENEYQKILEGERREEMEDNTMTDNVHKQPGATSTAEVIALLRQSVERKRRAVEEQVMDENARVRQERKKRKMEKVLSSIHQEEGEQKTEEQSEVLNSGGALDTVLQNQGGAAPAAVSPMIQPEDASSLGIMELVLQALNTQRIENARRFEVEQARHEQERREREERWRQTELRRTREHRQLMIAMEALLGDRFPDSLKHYLNQEDTTNSST